MKKHRYSYQRELILKLVQTQKTHLTAEQIYESAKEQIPNISLGTVYRNLNTLEELKEISSTTGPKQITYYENYAEPHHHFVCESCNTLTDLPAPTVSTCHQCISGKSPLQIKHVAMTLYGTCTSCLLKEGRVKAPLIMPCESSQSHKESASV